MRRRSSASWPSGDINAVSKHHPSLTRWEREKALCITDGSVEEVVERPTEAIGDEGMASEALPAAEADDEGMVF